MPMSIFQRSGVFSSEEIDQMRAEFEAGAQTDETEISREKRATDILVRFEAKRETAHPNNAPDA